MNSSTRLPIVFVYVRQNNRDKRVSALLDTGAAVSVINQKFVKELNLKSVKGKQVKLTGFNESSSYTDEYVSLDVSDRFLKPTFKRDFIVLKEIAVDLLIGFDCLDNLTIICEPNEIILVNSLTNENWFFDRKIPIDIANPVNKILKPGFNVLYFNFKQTGKSFNLKIPTKFNYENDDNLWFYDVHIHPFQNQLSVPFYNDSNSFVDPVKNHIFEIEEIQDEILKLDQKLPKHHRKNLKLPRLDLSSLKIGKNIDSDYKTELIKLIKKYHYCFSRSESVIGTYCGQIKYDIVLLNPIKECYKNKEFKGYEKEFIRKEIKNLLKNNIIIKYPCSRTLCGLTVAAKKSPKGKKLRLCLNSQIVNKNTRVQQNFQLPDLQQQIAKLSNRQFYCKWDLRAAYWNVKLPANQIGLYSFEFERVTYTWLRSSFGTRGMSAAFSCIMENVFGEIECCCIYMDDITCFGGTMKELLDTVKKVLQKASEFGLAFNLEKCSFFETEISAFGYKIDINGNRPDPERVKQLLEIPFPKTLKQLQSALGSINYFNRISLCWPCDCCTVSR